MNPKISLLALSLLAMTPAMTHIALAQGAGDAAQVYNDDDRAFMSGYIGRMNMPSATIPGEVTVGMQMPEGVQYHEIQGHARLQGHRYTHVNNRHVIVNKEGRVIAIHRM
ncbi:MAG: DUF1236 domain-containing protein [Phreatobacter sp.]